MDAENILNLQLKAIPVLIYNIYILHIGMPPCSGLLYMKQDAQISSSYRQLGSCSPD